MGREGGEYGERAKNSNCRRRAESRRVESHDQSMVVGFGILYRSKGRRRTPPRCDFFVDLLSGQIGRWNVSGSASSSKETLEDAFRCRFLGARGG